MLADDSPITKGEKDAEVRSHFSTGGQAPDGNGQRADPNHFERDAGASVAEGLITPIC